MDIEQFASDPSDPSWEKPTYRSQHLIDLTPLPPGVARPTRYDPKDRSERARRLYNLASDFTSLYWNNLSVACIDKFLLKWRDSAGLIQPNVLAWLNDTDIVSIAVEHSEELVLYLLKSGFKPNSIALTDAVLLDLNIPENINIIKMFITYGWDINEPLRYWDPPLISAILHSRELVEWCLSKGADPNACCQSSKSVMQRAAFYAPLDIIKLLVENGASLIDNADLIAHASYGHSRPFDRREVILYFLQNGVSINSYLMEYQEDNIFQLVGRQNALHLAIMGGKKDMVEFLLENGADKRLKVTTQTTNGKALSPAEYARLYKEEQIACLLD